MMMRALASLLSGGQSERLSLRGGLRVCALLLSHWAVVSVGVRGVLNFPRRSR